MTAKPRYTLSDNFQFIGSYPVEQQYSPLTAEARRQYRVLNRLYAPFKVISRLTTMKKDQ